MTTVATPTLAELHKQLDFVLSFELFPPKSDEGAQKLGGHLEKLREYSPNYVTCTYGAGGSTRDRTLSTLQLVQDTCPGTPVASHLTCVGATREDLTAYLVRARDQGVNYIVALRGDPPQGETEFTAVEGGFFVRQRVGDVCSGEVPGVQHCRGGVSRNASRGGESAGGLG